MDFRGLIAWDDSFALFGGMTVSQEVSNHVLPFSLEPSNTLQKPRSYLR